VRQITNRETVSQIVIQYHKS